MFHVDDRSSFEFHAGSSPESPWKSTPSELRTQAQNAVNSGGSSEMWKALASSRKLDPTAVVFVTDGEATDNLTKQRKQHIRETAPTLAIGVGAANMTTIRKMANLTGGRSFSARDPEAIESPLLDLLDRTSRFDHVMRYEAPTSGSVEREVTVSVEDDVQGETTYRVPRRDERDACPTTLARIRTQIEVGDTEVTRMLAGPDAVDDDAERIQVDEAEVLLEMMGRTIYTFEGPMPPMGVWTEEMLDDYLGNEKQVRAIQQGDTPEDWLQTLGGGEPQTPLVQYGANPPLQMKPTAGDRTYPTGLRTTIFREHLDLEARQWVRTLDILPTADIETMVSAPAVDPIEPTARWRFDGTLEGDVSSDHDLSASMNTQPQYTASDIGGQAIDIAPRQYFTADNFALESEGRFDEVSVCTWLHATREEHGGNDTILTFGADQYFWFGLESRQVRMEIAFADGETSYLTSSAIVDGEWHHVCGVYDGTEATVELWLDGQLDNQYEWSRERDLDCTSDGGLERPSQRVERSRRS